VAIVLNHPEAIRRELDMVGSTPDLFSDRLKVLSAEKNSEQGDNNLARLACVEIYRQIAR
jgi:hypothetical protein